MIDRRLDVPVGLVRVGIDVAPAAFDEVEQMARRLPGVELLLFGALAHRVGRGTHKFRARPAKARRVLCSCCWFESWAVDLSEA